MSKYTLWPGSMSAVARGCRCPVLDNGRGNVAAAVDRGGFWVAMDCPLHGFTGSNPYPDEQFKRESLESYSSDWA
jgi:hypothetical protein